MSGLPVTTATGVVARLEARGHLARERGDRVDRLLPRAGVVERARADHAQAVGVGVEAGQQVAGRLGDRVRVLRAQLGASRRPAASRAGRRPRRWTTATTVASGASARTASSTLSGHRQVVVQRRRRVLPRAPDVRLRGEVVDDVGRRVGDRRGASASASGRSAPAPPRRRADDLVAGGAAVRRPDGCRRSRVPPVIRARTQTVARDDDQVLERRRGRWCATRLVSAGARRRPGRVQPPLELAEHGAEQHVPPGRLRERARGCPTAAGTARPPGAGGAKRGERPGREVLGQRRRRRRAADARARAATGASRAYSGAEQRAVGDVHRDADRERRGARRVARDQGAEQLGVVVVDAEDALVERLLRGPDAGGDRAGQRPAQRACPVRTPLS